MATIKQEHSGRWRVRVRKKGHEGFSKTFRTKSAARAWANSIEDKIERGDLVGGVVAAEVTVCDLLAKYEREIAHRKKGYLKVEIYRIATLSAGLGDVLLLSLSPERVIQYADQRLLSVQSDTVRREMIVLSAAWEVAKSLWKYPLPDNPVKIATRVLVSTGTYSKMVERDRRVSDSEVARLFCELSGVMRDIVTLALETAMRRGEIARARGDDRVDGGLLIRDDKTGCTSVIPLSSIASAVLDRYPSGFCRQPASITQAFNRAKKRAGIEGLRFHDLRHEAASRLFEKGLSIEEVSKITRHSDWRSLKRYTHPSNDIIAEKLG